MMIQVGSHCLKGMLIQIMTNYGDPNRNHIYLMALTTFPARQSLKIMELFAAANYMFRMNILKKRWHISASKRF